ncbi:YczE/YyaS/YitT family protein [Clostridium omnivorum]|uniref:Membrane protein n=1 Tax=Clostridium omnivorum TaxID=1604902 RepID=A0ABQ5N602_9CLOT|nr:hypothetical protein [Clostridium sp. E14]GLC30561.1 membrane protein [Clostridium sp. E14]
MRKFILTLLRLLIGLFLYAVGIVFTINANLGLSPWDIFHQGISRLTGITMGQASIIIGVLIIILDWVMGEKIGIGTIGNMLLIGIFMDILMLNHVIPVFNNLIIRVLMLILGMFIIGVACYFYIGAGLGSGPRDGLMVALAKKTNKPVKLIRSFIEFIPLVAGYFLGGTLGIGTLAMMLFGGYFIQLSFKLFNFDIREVKHKFINDYIIHVKKVLLQQ